MMSESGKGDVVVLGCFVTNLNLTLEIFVAGPANADVGCRLWPEWSELLCIAKNMASTSSRGFKGQSKCPVHVLKENGHLQH